MKRYIKIKKIKKMLHSIGEMNANIIALVLVFLFIVFAVLEFVFSPSRPEPEMEWKDRVHLSEKIMSETYPSHIPLSEEEKRLIIEDPMNLFKIPRFKEMVELTKEIERQNQSNTGTKHPMK